MNYHDITERKEAEKGLLKLNMAIKNSGEVIFMTDKEGTITFMNNEFTKIYGFTADEVVGKVTPRILNSGLYPKENHEQLWHALLDKQRLPATPYINKCKNGNLIDVEGSADIIIDDKGEIIGFIAIQRDVSERKKAESELIKAKEKAETSDRLKTAFMNNISHEIRTPLNAILGFAPFVIEPDISQEEKESMLEILNISCDRLINTVTDYMNISLIVSGNMKAYPKPMNLSRMMEEVYFHFQKRCSLTNLELKLNIPSNYEHFILTTDMELLTKILNHLLDNAIKFTQKGFVEFGYIQKSDSGQKEVELFVKDTGQGISSNAQKRIFDAFMQEDIANTRAHEGSGLGLSIAKGLTQLLGGKIMLESEKDKGTTVSFVLPCEDCTEPEPDNVELIKDSSVEKSSMILIAEDDDSNYLFIETVLRDRRFKLLKAVNGQEAVDLCHKHPEIDLVLMDIKMPVMNGIEATQQIKSFRKDLPIIAVTAFAQNGDEHSFREAGCDDYISKPINKTRLFGLIKKHCNI
jgi:PAS domain S-box-containing protein